MNLLVTVGVVPNWSQVRLAAPESGGLLPLFMLLEESVQLHSSQTNFFPAQKDVQTSGLDMSLRNLSQTRVALTIFVGENERMRMCTLFMLFEGFI